MVHLAIVVLHHQLSLAAAAWDHPILPCWPFSLFLGHCDISNYWTLPSAAGTWDHPDTCSLFDPCNTIDPALGPLFCHISVIGLVPFSPCFVYTILLPAVMSLLLFKWRFLRLYLVFNQPSWVYHSEQVLEGHLLVIYFLLSYQALVQCHVLLLSPC